MKIGQTVRFGVLSQQLEELEPYMGDTIREVLSNYKKYYVIDGKETSPEKLCERLGIDASEAIAFGDGENDLSMFSAVGTSVAMGNAQDTVKAAATYVTTAVDDDGIYNAAKHFGLL